MDYMKSRIELADMEFFAHHGCFYEERVIGNRFLVNLSVEYDCSKAMESDNIEDALNYQILFDIVKEQMMVPSNLLENVAGRIIGVIRCRFDYILSGTLSIDKLNPPLGGKVGSSRIVVLF